MGGQESPLLLTFMTRIVTFARIPYQTGLESSLLPALSTRESWIPGYYSSQTRHTAALEVQKVKKVAKVVILLFPPWNPRNRATSATIELRLVYSPILPGSIQSYPFLLLLRLFLPGDSSRRTETALAREASKRSLTQA